MKSVRPSLGARATYSAAIMLLLPGRFSTITGWPTRSDMYFATNLATVSAADDAPKPTTILMGPEGRSSAQTFWGANRDPNDKKHSVKKLIPFVIGFLPEVPLAI